MRLFLLRVLVVLVIVPAFYVDLLVAFFTLNLRAAHVLPLTTWLAYRVGRF